METDYEMPEDAYQHGYRLGFAAGQDIRDRGGISSKHHSPDLMAANDPYALGYQRGLTSPVLETNK